MKEYNNIHEAAQGNGRKRGKSRRAVVQLNQQLRGLKRMGIWTPFSRSPSTIQVMATAGTLKIVFPSGNDNSKFSSISTIRECNSIILSNRRSASEIRHLKSKTLDSREFPTNTSTSTSSCDVARACEHPKARGTKKRSERTEGQNVTINTNGRNAFFLFAVEVPSWIEDMGIVSPDF